MKSNMQIYFLAIIFVAMLNALNNSKRAICLVLMVIVAYYVQSFSVALVVRQLSNCQLNLPIPPLAWVAMGLQKSDLAPGWWNAYIVDSYLEAHGDLTQHMLMIKASIKDSIGAFVTSPSYTMEFFTEKILSTWGNPTFQCFGTVRNGTYVVTPSWVEYILSYSTQCKIIYYLNALCFLIYFGALLDAILSKFESPDEFILPMIFIGGFVFYLFWETKARYALMFFVVLIPCAMKGYQQAIMLLTNQDKKNGKAGKKKENKERENQNNRIWSQLYERKVRICIVVITALVFCGIYGMRFHYILDQDTEMYNEYISTSPRDGDIPYIGS